MPSVYWVLCLALAVGLSSFALYAGGLSDRHKLLAQRHSDLFSDAPEFVGLVGHDGACLYVSSSCETYTGYPATAFYRDPQLLHALIYNEDYLAWEKFMAFDHQHDEPASLEFRLMDADNQQRWVSYYRTPIRNKHSLAAWRFSIAEITERKKYESHIQYLANYDALTDIPNRRYLLQEMAQLIDKAKPFAVLFLDLDRFKNINDSLGHTSGDRVLLQLSEKLKKMVGQDAFLARFGGDEFVVLSCDVALVPELAEQIVQLIQQPVELGEHRLYVSCSLGVSCFPDNGDDFDSLLKNADAAMYKAKAQSNSRVRFFDQSINTEHQRRFLLEKQLHEAVDNDDLEVYFQPKVDIQTGNLVGAECLLRWNSGDSRRVPPSEFIPIAEESGLIVGIGDRVLETACHWLASPMCPNDQFQLAVNVSALQLDHARFVSFIESLLKRFSIAPAQLELEVTESVFAGQDSGYLQLLRQLHEQGIQISIDDFGTGFSSLARLRDLPVDALKIDKQFIDNMLSSDADRAITESIITMAHSLGLKVIAEGVETSEQLTVLRDLSCDQVQGYYYSRPLPIREFESFIQSNTIERSF